MARSRLRYELLGVVGLLALLLVAYQLSFVGLLFTSDGAMGHDYRFFLPILLSGYFWYQTNGPAHVPWFSPSQCGGLPFLGDLQVPYYSVPQILTLLQAPSGAVVTTFLVFAAIGFLGAYGLLRFAFRTGPWMAGAGATFFMFNGFFAYRMLVGHLTYHAFMLTPLLAWVLLTMPRTGGGTRSWVRAGGHVAAGSLIIGYMVHAGMGNVLLVPVMAIGALLVLHAVIFGWQPRPWVGGILCGVGSLAIAAIKLVPSLAFLSRFPRDFYILPGFATAFDALQVAFSSLFLSISADSAVAKLVNRTGWPGEHEWEYGVTVVPLVLLVFALGLRWGRRPRRAALNSGRVFALVSLALLALVPLALNVYAEGWNRFLKSLPLIGQSPTPFRMFAVYILPASVIPVILLDRVRETFPNGALARIAIVAIGAVVVLKAMENKDYYAVGHRFDPGVIDRAYLEARESGRVPAITSIAADNEARGEISESMPRSDAFTDGGSVLKCYQPIFGYRLETFPIGSLTPGPITAVRHGVFNLKNPSCYVFPAENGCVPGDHFTVDQRAAMEDFAAYRPFSFAMPRYQIVATWVSLLSAGAVLATLMTWLAVAIRHRGGHD